MNKFLEFRLKQSIHNAVSYQTPVNRLNVAILHKTSDISKNNNRNLKLLLS